MKQIKLYGRLSTRKSDALAAYYEFLGGFAFVATVVTCLFWFLFGDSGLAFAFAFLALLTCVIAIWISYKIIVRFINILK